VNDHALKLEMLRQGMGWGRLPEFLAREEIVKKNLIRLSESLISSISIPVYLLRKRNTVPGPVTQQVWDYFLGSIDAENSNHPA
jgi:DNA-binding transcriptional LysR family regulator